MPGDVVQNPGGVGVIVPPPGNTVYALGLKDSGGEDELEVTTSLDGTVTVVRNGSTSTSSSDSAIAVDQ